MLDLVIESRPRDLGGGLAVGGLLSLRGWRSGHEAARGGLDDSARLQPASLDVL